MKVNNEFTIIIVEVLIVFFANGFVGVLVGSLEARESFGFVINYNFTRIVVILSIYVIRLCFKT